MPKSPRAEVLRRRSFRIISWIFTLFFGTAAVGLTISLAYDLSSETLTGAAVSLGILTVVHHICGSRILLNQSSLTIVNPFFTHIVPYKLIADVTPGGDGTLTIVTRQGDEIRCTAFGGSIIDHFVGSTERAAERIQIRLKRKHRNAEHLTINKRFTVAWTADLCTVGAIIGTAVTKLIGF
ncbi:hypothetical protein ACFU76_07395 [Streptomyces sp. NPDC057539]|uniref:hypothetical protein n=1 Tax=Streptomyces sp. NPDC057539 TaxID=3346159 RepID=UPI003678438D